MMLVKTFCVLFTGCHAVMMDTTERKYFDDYVYYPEVNGWLKLHREAAEWHEARVTCHLEEALLATNWSAEIISIVNELQSSGNQSFEALHSGAELSMAVTEYGTYSYLEGEPTLSVTSAGLKRLEQCIAFTANGTMEAVDCRQKLPYACFATEHACGSNNLGYRFYKETGHCYKFHDEEITWPEAYKVCAEEGGYLVVINGEAEAELLKEIVVPHQTDKTLVAAGFYYFKFSDSWRTVDGQTIEQAGFSQWERGEPTLSVYPHAIAGYFNYTDGKLYSQYYHINKTFICEKNPLVFKTNAYH